jgi:hypothetical protein
MEAQISDYWKNYTDSIFNKEINKQNNNIDNEAKESFNYLIKSRDGIGFKNRIDTAKADLVVISEYYNPKTKQIDYRENYYYFKDSIKVFRTKSYNNGTWDSYKLYQNDFDELKWKYSKIDSIFPRDYIYQGGCVITKWKRIKINRFRKKLLRIGQVKESYYIIDNWIDKTNNYINISFRIPIYATRHLDSSFGPFGGIKRPELKPW